MAAALCRVKTQKVTGPDFIFAHDYVKIRVVVNFEMDLDSSPEHKPPYSPEVDFAELHLESLCSFAVPHIPHIYIWNDPTCSGLSETQ